MLFKRAFPFLSLLLAAAFPSGGPAASPAAEEAVRPGDDVRERTIAAGEAHAYGVEVAGAPLLITVQQHGIDLAVEDQGPAQQDAALSDAPNDAWGLEVLVLPAEAAGRHRIEVRPGRNDVQPGRYTIRAEALATDTVDEKRRAAALATMSRAGQRNLYSAGGRSQMLSDYREALAIWQSLPERRWEAETLHALASVELQSDDLRSAVDHYRQGEALWHDLTEPYREANALKLLGMALSNKGEIPPAREALEKALALWRGLEVRMEEAATRNELCLLEQSSGALPAARHCYEETQALYDKLGGYHLERAAILNSLGGLDDLQGEPDKALAHYNQALELRRKLEDRSAIAQTLNNIAVIHRALGEWQEALRIYDEVRKILEPLGSLSLEARRLNNVGYIYRILGEPQRALTFMENALDLLQRAGGQKAEITTLNNIGSVWRSQGELEKALGLSRQARKLAVDLGDTRQEALTRVHLAEIHLEQGDASAALREIDPALAHLQEAGLRTSEIEALQLRGRALTRAGRPREALSVLKDVVTRQQARRDPAGEAEALLALAAAKRSLGDAAQAREDAEKAVARVEELRAGLVSPKLRAAFLATRQRAYSFLIDLLMALNATEPGKGHDREAFAISERARARSLLDALHAGTSGHPGSAIPGELAEQRRSLLRRLAALADQRLRENGDPAKAPEQEIEQKIDKLLADLDRIEAEIGRYDPRFAALRDPQPVSPEEIGTLLDRCTLFLEYSLGEERSYLWTVDSAGTLRSFVLERGQREIEDLARRLYADLSTLKSGATSPSDAAGELGRILLEPVWSEAARFDRLVVVPDGALHAVPFAALRAPNARESRPAAESRLLDLAEVVSIPSATTLAFQQQRLGQRPPAPKLAAVLADPVFQSGDPRLKPPKKGQGDPGRGQEEAGLFSGFVRLPSSREEAEDILRLAPAGQVWTALDFEANRETVLSGKLRDYRIVHFATHGEADTRTPELSRLVLSLVDAAGRPREGFLGVSDIYDLDLGADLVGLSGCKTALGKEVRGEGLMGLTRAFQYAGVPSVVASLWRAPDQATAELMDLFYKAMWQEHLPPGAALRKAQQDMRRNPFRKSPYHWAGFVLQGDWR